MCRSSYTLLYKIYDPPFPRPQHSSAQQPRQPAHAKPVKSWVNTFAHWGFIWEQHRMQAMQQQWLHIEPQQFEAAFTKISAASGSFGSSDPGAVLSAVATKFPNPTHKLCGNIIFRLSESFCLLWLFFEAYMMFIKNPLENSKTLCVHNIVKAVSNIAVEKDSIPSVVQLFLFQLWPCVYTHSQHRSVHSI